jgi:predicted transcriptional regulator
MPSKITTPIIVRLDNDTIARLDRLAAQQSRSRSAVARTALEAGLEMLQRPAPQEPKTGRRGAKDKARAKGATAEAPPAAELDLVTFAAQVIEAAQRTETGRFGKDLVFINHVWRQFEREHKPEGMDLEAFKRHLAEANQGRFLSLAPAGGARKRERKDVEESEARRGADTFHLVRL